MYELFMEVGMPNHIRRYFSSEDEIDAFVADFIAPGRAENNIVAVTQADAVQIFRVSAIRILEVGI